MWKIQAKAKQEPEVELLTNMYKTEVCLYDWDYMTNCNKNESVNGKVDHINKTNIDQYVDIEANIENIACLGKTISLSNKATLKQHFRLSLLKT